MPPLRVVTNALTRAGAGQSGAIQSAGSSMLGELGVKLLQIRRERRREAEPYAGVRVLQLELRGVQRLPMEIACSGRQTARKPRAAIDAIADQWIAERLHVHADLMRAAGFQSALDLRPALSRAQQAVVGHGLLATRDYGHACSCRRMTADCRLHFSGGGHNTDYIGDIDAGYAARLELAY